MLSFSASQECPSKLFSFFDPQVKIENKEDQLNQHPMALNFQTQYEKNFGLIKEKFKKSIPEIFSLKIYEKYALLFIEKKMSILFFKR